MSRPIICDICEQEIKNANCWSIKLNPPLRDMDEFYAIGGVSKQDVCELCANKMRETILGMIKSK